MPSHFKALLIFLYLCLCLISASAYSAKPQEASLIWAERLANSLMTEHPEAWKMRKSDGRYRWAYVQGLVLKGFLELNQLKPSEKYESYVKQYLDKYIDKQGNIRSYHMDEFNIDGVNSGKLLFYFYKSTQDPRYLNAANLLKKQLTWHPRTRSGVFWHKRKYPWQIWLDGLYMAAPFYAQYEHEFNDNKDILDVIQQFEVSYQSLYDSKTGLLFHGYDESRIQRWANKDSGLSPQFWSRALGWYAMALVDTIEHVEDKQAYSSLQKIVLALFSRIASYQDKKSGLWFQVMDQGNKQDNYLETSASAMFIYSFSKAARLGLVNKRFRSAAETGFKGLLQQNLLQYDASTGQVRLDNVCRSAGLGGEPYRDGSYDYYVRQTDKVSNDAHGLGALLLALTELARKT